MGNRSKDVYQRIIGFCAVIASVCFLLILGVSIFSGFEQMTVVLLLLTLCCSLLTWNLYVMRRKKT